MRYLHFKNKIFQVLLLLYFSLMSIYNLYFLTFYFPNGWLAFATNFTILFLIIYKYTHLKLILRIWSLIFLIILHGLQIIAKIIKAALNVNECLINLSFIKAFIFTLVGILIFYLSGSIIKTEDIDSIDEKGCN